MKEFPVERMCRDARITTIYEGTSQLQVVAAIRAVINDTYSLLMEIFEKTEVSKEFKSVKNELTLMKKLYEQARKLVSEMNSNEMLDLHARRLVEMAAYPIMTYLLMFDAMRCSLDELTESVHHFLRYGKAVCVGNLEYIKK